VFIGGPGAELIGITAHGGPAVESVVRSRDIGERCVGETARIHRIYGYLAAGKQIHRLVEGCLEGPTAV
jgi:hypothetical protein